MYDNDPECVIASFTFRHPMIWSILRLLEPMYVDGAGLSACRSAMSHLDMNSCRSLSSEICPLESIMSRIDAPSAWSFCISSSRSRRNSFLGRGRVRFRWCLWYSYSLANALPIGADLIEPEQTRYAVITEKLVFSFPLKVIPLQRPRPDGSRMAVPCASGTIFLVAKVTVPPDWKLSVSRTGSISCVGELYAILAIWNWRFILSANDMRRWGCCQAEFVSAMPVISESMDAMHER